MNFSRISSIQGSIIAFVVFVLLALLIPGHGPADDVELVLTIASFLFAILAGFFISRSSGRYDRIREAISSEDAAWVALYENSKMMSPDFLENISDIIDGYYITGYDYGIDKQYKASSKHIEQIHEELRTLDIDENPKADQLFDDLVSLVNTIESNRNTISVLGSERLNKGQWTVLILLAGIITFSIYFLKIPELYSQAFAVILSTVLVIVLSILRDLENLNLTGKGLAIESGEEVFETIGKLRYYSEARLYETGKTIPSTIESYRLGLHKPGEPHNIKIVRNPKFKQK